MTETSKYKPYEHILKALIEGEEVQWKGVNSWFDQDSDVTMKEIADLDNPPECYRIRPRTININGYEVPEPLKEMPSGALVYYASITMPDLVEVVYIDHHPCPNTNRLLNRKLLHSTREAAVKHAEALLSFTETK